MKKTEDSHVRELTEQLKVLEHKEANSPLKSRCQEIINLSAEIDKIETRKTIQNKSIQQRVDFSRKSTR